MPEITEKTEIPRDMQTVFLNPLPYIIAVILGITTSAVVGMMLRR